MSCIDRLFLCCLGAIAILAATSLAPAQAQYDLTSQWSFANNPNGPWSCNQGTTPLPLQPSWLPGSWPTPQPGWAVAPSGLGHVPVWLRQVGLPNGVTTCGPAPSPNWDACVGDVLVHSTDSSSVGTGLANVTWTSPLAGVVDICGGAWMVRDIGRSNNWRLYKNVTLLSQGTVSSGDPYSRSSPFPFSQGSGGSPALSGVPVIVGDVIRLEIVRTGASGDFCGVTLSISASSTAPASCAAGAVGAGAGGPYDVLRINGSAGLPSRRVGVGLNLPFTFAVSQPPGNLVPAHFIIAGYVGVPCTQDVTPLPGSFGILCFLPSLLGSTQPGAFMLADSLGLGFGVLPATAAPWGFTVGGVGFPLQLTLQGVIEESPGVFRTTNAITLSAP